SLHTRWVNDDVEGRMAGLGEGTVERVFVVTAIALWLLLSGCSSVPAGDTGAAEAATESADVDTGSIQGGAFASGD
ncbi:MAG: hypothetical protein KJP18_05195, partial [Gemmatimonadetes bacterium]|nr:hypothetical protein [Gemmatimonadota bacterium]